MHTPTKFRVNTACHKPQRAYEMARSGGEEPVMFIWPENMISREIQGRVTDSIFVHTSLFFLIS